MEKYPFLNTIQASRGYWFRMMLGIDTNPISNFSRQTETGIYSFSNSHTLLDYMVDMMFARRRLVVQRIVKAFFGAHFCHYSFNRCYVCMSYNLVIAVGF